MHEASVVEQLVKTLTRKAAESGASGIIRVNLVIGEASGYMEESLKFYFAAMGRGTMAEGAELICRYIKPVLKCTGCGKGFERKRFSFDCPDCGSTGIMTKTGTEFYIESMEVDNVPECR